MARGSETREQVLTEGGLPKGSLYVHFPDGKEQLAVESLRQANDELCAAMAATLAAAPDPATALERVLAVLGEHLAGTDFREGCPVATVALDAAAQSEPGLQRPRRDGAAYPAAPLRRRGPPGLSQPRQLAERGAMPGRTSWTRCGPLTMGRAPAVTGSGTRA